MNVKKRSLSNILGNRLFVKNSRGQIWVETMIYTLIAFALIGLVLAFVKPKIEEIQDRGLIEQSISVLNDLDSVMSSLGVAGNQRVIDLAINKGTLTFDGVDDKIFFLIESRSEYSEPGENVSIGNVVAVTETAGSKHEITLTRDYSNSYNLTYADSDSARELSSAPNPYKLVLTNKGEDNSGHTIVNIEVTG